MTQPIENSEIPISWLPMLTWNKFMYRQQIEFSESKTWQTWYIAGNGTGKTLIIYLNAVMHMMGAHPNALGKPPIKIKCLVPSFDYVEDVALEKLLDAQRVLFNPTKLSKERKLWIDFLISTKAVKDYGDDYFLIGPMLPADMIKPKKGYSRDHRGLELKNGSSIWWSTSEQGWQAQRGGEQDILISDEEGEERVWDEMKRGLRHAKGGGKIIAGLTPPYEPGQGPTWTKEKILEASLTDPDITCINACMADNPSVTSEFIKRFSRGKTKRQIDVQIWGKYPSWGDLVYPHFEDRLWNPDEIDGHILPNDTPMPENYEVDWVMAFDWHSSKPCAAVFGWVDRDGNVVFFDELDKEWAQNRQIDELADGFFSIEGYPHARRSFRRWQDPSAKTQYKAVVRGFNAWDAFRQVGIVTSAGKNRDPDVGIGIVSEYFRGNGTDHPRVFFFERMKYTRQYLNNHFWKRDESGKGKPDPKWSDYPICIRYILQEIGWKHRSYRRKKWRSTSYQPRDDRQRYDIARMMN